MQNKIRQAFILGAGFGTRLWPLTDAVPKVMVPIAPGKPLLEHIILLLKEQGIKDFIVNVHHLPEKIIFYFGDGSKFGVRIHYSDETKELLETAGALKRAGPMLNDNFLFLYGDELHFFDFTPAIALHADKNPLATIILKRTGFPQDADLAQIDRETKKIIKWHKRPHGITELGKKLFANAGLYVLSKRILDYIPAGRPVKLDEETIPVLIAEKLPVCGLPTDETIIDIGKPEKYELAKKYYKERTVFK